MTPAEVRVRIARIAKTRGESLASLSRVIGRNPAYLQQYLRRGSPERLDEDVRLALAKHWQISERELGARDPWEPGK